MRNAFQNYNPITCFVFFILAIVFGICFVNPVFLTISIVFSILTLSTTRERKNTKYLFGLIPLFFVIALVNPLINTNGSHIITYIFGRPYTMESLAYGVTVGLMFISVIIWFASFNLVMTGDKIMYIFGGLIPSISLMISMILRFIPKEKKRAKDISLARASLGKSVINGSKKEKIENGMATLLALTSSSLENGVTTANSMNARGYGVGKRTYFKIYSFKTTDIIAVIILAVLAGLVIFCGIKGGMKYDYSTMEIAMGKTTYMGMIVYSVFLSIPALINIAEEVKWHNLK